jgi:GST-like protein
MFGQLGFFHKFAGREVADPLPRKRYADEARRLLKVLDGRLAGRLWIMCEDYTIADVATWPWVRTLDFYEAWELVGVDDFPNVTDWFERALARPASQAALNIPDRNG